MRFLTLGLLLFFFVVVAFADISTVSSEEEQYLQSNRSILFVSQAAYPPFEYRDISGERQGMSIELIRWMSTEFGFQAVFTDMTSQEAREALVNGEADVIASFFYSQSGDSLFDLTEPIFEVPARIFVQPGTVDIHAVADLEGRKVAVQTGSCTIEFLDEEGVNCTLVQTDNLNNALHLLLNGEVDALVGDEQIIEFYLLIHHSSGDLVAVGDTLYSGMICMAVAQGDSLLCSVLNRGIEHALDKGIIEAIANKWQGSPFTISDEFRHGTRFLVISGIVLIITVLVFLWNLRLRHVVEQKTRSLHDSERRLDQALDQANLGSWDFNIQTGETINNDRYSIMLGYSPGEVDFSQKVWLDQIHPDDRSDLEAYIEEYLADSEGRFETEYRLRTKEGGWLSIHSYGGIVERDLNGKPLRIAGIHQDVTRRKISEALARRAVDDWENTFDALPELIAVLDSQGAIVRVNRAQALVLGKTRVECTGLNLSSLIYGDGDKEALDIPFILAGEKSPPLQERHIEKLGGDFEISLLISEDPRDGSTRIIHVARDVTKRKLAEKKQKELQGRIQHSQKLESLGVLAGGIAHDFNNILMAVRGYTDLAISSANQGDQIYEYLKEISKSVNQASELTGQMLAYSGRGNFVVETVYIDEIIDKMKPMFKLSVSRKAELKIHSEGSIPPVEVDSTQMEQVIMNLVTNASEAIGSSSGVITITTGLEETQPPGPVFSEEARRPYVFIQVEDTGCGMSRETIEKLFEPFFSTKFAGRGLGMAVVQGIVEGHKGFITVKSKEGSGSSIKAFIPALDRMSGQTVQNPSRKTGVSDDGKKVVLFVDDEANIMFIGKHVLEKEGYAVLSASDGEEALKAYRENSDTIQCVILDLTMPVMDGAECLRELRAFDSQVRVILSSGYNRQDAESRIPADHIAGYLKKPYSLQALATEVRRVLAD
ncbi:MAG: transporter substrate-binding domain-containing protein [Candidatus Sabulitectum sp.]|nr:transporter substrate-binding domain-containing protein [Candidatus Sabulitectum sp.]